MLQAVNDLHEKLLCLCTYPQAFDELSNLLLTQLQRCVTIDEFLELLLKAKLSILYHGLMHPKTLQRCQALNPVNHISFVHVCVIKGLILLGANHKFGNLGAFILRLGLLVDLELLDVHDRQEDAAVQDSLLIAVVLTFAFAHQQGRDFLSYTIHTLQERILLIK